MDRLQPGFRVFGIDDRRLGTVKRIDVCCFEVVRADGAPPLHLRPQVIFNVDGTRVTLVCVNDEVHRYFCERSLHETDATASP